MRSIISVLLVTCILVLMAQPGLVAAASSKSAATLSIGDETMLAFAIPFDLVKRVDPFVKHTSKGYVLTADRDEIGLSSEEWKVVTKQISVANEIDMQLRDIGITDGIIQGHGENKIVAYWWGIEIFMDNHLTNQMAYALEIGTGATTLITIIMAAIPALGAIPAVVAGVISFIQYLGATALRHHNQGHGVILRFYLGWPSVRPQ